MVNRIYSVKKNPSPEAKNLLEEITNFLGIKNLKNLQIVNRYDIEGLNEDDLKELRNIVFSEPQVDDSYLETLPLESDFKIAVENLPGQFDQRASSASECSELLTGIRPNINYAKVYLLNGDLREDELDRIESYLINPVESRKASLEKPETLRQEIKPPEDVAILENFINLNKEETKELRKTLNLAMDEADFLFLQDYFKRENRNPTVTEIKVIDTYWSDHCRHTTFSTILEKIDIEDSFLKERFENYQKIHNDLRADKPMTLMDMATIGAKYLKSQGFLKNIDESEEINACSMHLPALINGKEEDYLLQFKNETHNHPTEIEPFGGAATCIGGCIRDPLSGRAYVHQAMRVTGAADPRASFEETIEGKLPQRQIVQTAAEGYSSYGNQIGLATGLVSEKYHPGYAAKRLECGVVVGAVKAKDVIREEPKPGDIILLIGGRTGRDGIGGATGSSKKHTQSALETMASEVQKGNAPEERKIQRLFRRPDVTNLIKRCNDFGAGGVSVAIGELADSLDINLDLVRKKYEGLDGTEIAISESQERMAVVVDKDSVEDFIKKAEEENLEAYPVAEVKDHGYLKMYWHNKPIVNISREFLNTNGAPKHTSLKVSYINKPETEITYSLRETANNLKTALQRGLVERFDSTIGAGSLLLPYGGKTQRTPAQAMAALLPVGEDEETNQASVMAFGFDPNWSLKLEEELDSYDMAYQNVLSSLSKLVSSGADYKEAYLSLQEFFEKLGDDPKRWAKPFKALLGALDAQLDFNIGAIGGKDSMSGSFLDLDVPPTLISFAIAPIKAEELITPEFKEAGNYVYFAYSKDKNELKEIWEQVRKLNLENKIKAAYATEIGGIKDAITKMSFGNLIGFEGIVTDLNLSSPYIGGIIIETSKPLEYFNFIKLGKTIKENKIIFEDDQETIETLLELSEKTLESVYPTTVNEGKEVEIINFTTEKTIKGPKVKHPQILIPVFPGTNCEYDSAKQALKAGLKPVIFILNNQTPEKLQESVEKFAQLLKESQILFLPGGFSAGDEPEGSAKFIASFSRNEKIKDSIMDLIENRDGLILGICNGFQALIKLGLLPYGKIISPSEFSPTLTFNNIGRHQSKIVQTRISSNLSPWLNGTKPGNIYSVPISHGEGRFSASPALLEELKKSGQIATQYVDLNGNPTMDTSFNPNGSDLAIEAISSPDGRILGKMGHTERIGDNLYQNVPGNYNLPLFENAFNYYNQN